MEFTLYFRGPLRPNGSAGEKHCIRKVFHSQLRELWHQMPLSGRRRKFLHPYFQTDVPETNELSVIMRCGGFAFAPLVTEKLRFAAGLEIVLLRPEPPGSIVVQSGDIDNRLKTLLDALKVPSEPNALPPGTQPGEGEEPFFCLLEDDKLVTRISIETDRLLEPGLDRFEAVILVRVRTLQLVTLAGTIGLH